MGEVIRVTRIANNLTISSLSEKSGVSKSYISEIEKGKKKPSTDILNRLAPAFDLEEQDLYGFDELHNSIIKSEEKLYVYRTLLISILELYNNREKQQSTSKVKTKSLGLTGLDSCHKKI